MRKRLSLLLIILFSTVLSLGAQESILAVDSSFAYDLDLPDFSNRVLLAMSNSDYPVTPGDVYRLVFKLNRGGKVSLFVDATTG